MHYKEIVIAGGGPAGAYCAYNLAKKGIHPTIIDHTHPREKPCGGAILPKVIKKFEFVEKFRSKSGSLANLRIITPTNKEVPTNRYEKGFTVSRQIFDKEIIEMAIENGAELVEEKIMGVSKKNEHWKIETSKRTLSSNTLVGADGVNSKVRYATIGAFSRKDLAITFGYIATGIEKEKPVMKFLDKINGYIWNFPRHDHSSVGIGGELKHGKKMKKLLDDFISYYFPHPKIKIISRFAAMIPSAKSPDFFKKPCAGKDWILVGDAAGHVDPVSRDGIYYALWSGKLAADAIERNNLESYETQWRKEYGSELEELRKQRDFFYDPRIIDKIVETRKSSMKNTDSGAERPNKQKQETLF